VNIRTRLIVTFIALTIIPISVVGAIIFYTAQDTILKRQKDELSAIADLKVIRIESFFNERKGDITTAQQYYNIKKNLPIVTRLANDRTNPEYIAAKKMLDDQLITFERIYGYADFLLVSPEGEIVYTANDTGTAGYLGLLLSDPDGKAFAEGKKGIYFSDVFRNKRERNKLSILLTAPAYDFDGNFIGVIALDIDMDPIYNFIQDKTGLGGSGETLIVKRYDKHIKFLNTLRHDPKGALEKSIFLGDKDSIPAQLAAQGIRGSGTSIDYRGKEVVAAWTYISSLGWGLVAKVDIVEAFAPIYRLRNISMVIIAISLGMFALATIYIVTSISKPILNLTKVAKTIAKGNLDVEISLELKETKDEAGLLAVAFSEMAVKLKESYRDLEKKIKERTGQLEQALKVKSDFVSMVSHELRTPLTAIKEGIALVLDETAGAVNKDQKEFLDIAKRNVDRLARLINAVLDMQKIESGKMSFDMRENDINEVIREAGKTMSSMAKEKRLDLTVNLAEGLPKVRLDKDRIIQVLTNLVSNAIKFTEKGGITIFSEKGYNCIQVSVRDTGPGIEQENLPRLFQRFEQLERGIGRKTGGTGLGLAISKEIIEAHGGKIWAESKAGAGAVFSFTLPA